LAGVPGLDKVGCGALGVSQSSESGHLQKYEQSDGMSIQTLPAATLEYWVPFFRVSDFISVVKGVPHTIISTSIENSYDKRRGSSNPSQERSGDGIE
jgi:hypothetical protein